MPSTPSPTSRGTVARWAAIAATAAVATTLGTGVAAADDGNTRTTLYTLASTGTCAGTLTAGVSHYPNEADLVASGTLYGVGSCSLDIDFVFTSRADGHTATFTRHFSGPGFIGLPGADIVSPGAPGVYDVTVSPRAPHLGGQRLTIDTVYRG